MTDIDAISDAQVAADPAWKANDRSKWPYVLDEDGADLFTSFERLETCSRTEVTLENLPALAQLFGGSAVYGPIFEGHWRDGKPRLVIPNPPGADRVTEVGAWIDQKGSRWNPEPLTQGWRPAGTYVEVPQ